MLAKIPVGSHQVLDLALVGGILLLIQLHSLLFCLDLQIIQTGSVAGDLSTSSGLSNLLLSSCSYRCNFFHVSFCLNFLILLVYVKALLSLFFPKANVVFLHRFCCFSGLWCILFCSSHYYLFFLSANFGIVLFFFHVLQVFLVSFLMDILITKNVTRKLFFCIL